jgi:hypothetical protein
MKLWKSWTDFVWNCKTIVVPLTLLIAACTVLFMMGRKDLAGDVSSLGTALVLFGNILYIVFLHSRKKWPDVPWYVRFYRLFTFHR